MKAARFLSIGDVGADRWTFLSPAHDRNYSVFRERRAAGPRPAEAGCVAALRGGEPIADLTAGLAGIREDDWNIALAGLFEEPWWRPAASLDKTSRRLAIAPRSLGQAQRISGINPADISVVMLYLDGRLRLRGA